MKPKFAIGEVVCVKMEHQTIAGKVVACDETGLPVQYRVHAPLKDDYSLQYEGLYPEEALLVVTPLGHSGPFSAAKVMARLKTDEFLDLLKRGIEGRTTPRAGLRPWKDKLLFTFVEDSTHLTGAAIPPFAVERDRATNELKLLASAKPRTILFLRSFGLNLEQAEDVVRFFPTLF